jgi:hypothetical protein
LDVGGGAQTSSGRRGVGERDHEEHRQHQIAVPTSSRYAVPLYAVSGLTTIMLVL